MSIKNSSIQVLISFFILVASAGAETLSLKSKDQEVFEPGGRIGYVDSAGNLKVRAKSNNAAWITVAQQVQDFQLRDSRIAVRQTDGKLQIWDGSLDNMRGTVIDEVNVQAYQLGVSRIGILDKDNTLLVTDWGKPVPIATNVQAFQILADRVGVLGLDGSFWVQEGLTTEKFHKLAENVASFQMDKEWIAYTDQRKGRQASRLMLGRGQVAGMSFVEQATNVTDFELEVWPDPAKQHEHRVRLAYIKGGEVHSGGGHLEPVIMEKGFYNHFVSKRRAGMQAQKVHWAGGQLISENESGVVNIDEISRDGEAIPIATGRRQDLRWNAEGVFLLRAADGKLERGDRITSPIPAKVDEIVTAENTEFEISSKNPTFARRPISMPKKIDAGIKALVFLK